MSQAPVISTPSVLAPKRAFAAAKKTDSHKDAATAIEMVVDCFLTDGIDVWQQVKGQAEKRGEKFSFRKDWREVFSEAGAHAMAGEIISDPLGGAAFVGVKRYMPRVMGTLGWALDLKPVDFLYEKLGHIGIRGTAKKEGLAPDSEAYRAKLDEWKFYQKHRIAEWAVVTVGSVAGNVLVQKVGWHLSDNFKRRLAAHDHDAPGHHHAADESPLPTRAPETMTILKGKMKGVLYTFILVEVMGLLAPGAMQKLNHWIAGKIKSTIDWARGRKPEAAEASAETPRMAETDERTIAAAANEKIPEPVLEARDLTAQSESESKPNRFRDQYAKAPHRAEPLPAAFSERKSQAAVPLR